MKNFLTLSLSFGLLFFITSCKKKTIEPTEADLNGTWELRYLAGIQVAGMDPNYKPGNGNLLKFNQESYERYDSGKLVDSGKFTIKPDVTTVSSSQTNYSILLKNQTKLYLNLSAKKLIVFDGIIASDGTEATYEKQ